MNQKIAKAGGWKILIWAGLIFFFVYSYQATIDLEDVTDPRRQQALTRILIELTQPNLFEYEYETRETPIVLEVDCQNPNDTTQEIQMGDGTIVFDIDCKTSRRAAYTIHGTGFQPNTTGYIVWYPESTFSSWANTEFDVDKDGGFLVKDFPFLIEPIVSGHTVVVVEQISKTFRGLSETSYRTIGGMWETIQIAFLATVMSAIFAIPFTFLCVRASSSWGYGFRFLLQPVLAAIRSIHPLIMVFPAVVLAGIGPTAGVLAITLFSTAILITDFSDYAQQHTSLNWHTLLKVHFPSLAFKRFPANVAIASIIGFLGGGGIGFLLQQWFSLLDYRDASVAILAIIFSIGSLDLLSRAVWLKIQKGQ